MKTCRSLGIKTVAVHSDVDDRILRCPSTAMASVLPSNPSSASTTPSTPWTQNLRSSVDGLDRGRGVGLLSTTLHLIANSIETLKQIHGATWSSHNFIHN